LDERGVKQQVKVIVVRPRGRRPEMAGLRLVYELGRGPELMDIVYKCCFVYYD
jgi:hypothetical protein